MIDHPNDTGKEEAVSRRNNLIITLAPWLGIGAVVISILARRWIHKLGLGPYFYFLIVGAALLGCFLLWPVRNTSTRGKVGWALNLVCLLYFAVPPLIYLWLASPTQAVWRYPAYVEKLRHFPKSIPPHAEEVKFYYFSFWGRRYARLRMKLPKAECEELERKAREEYTLLSDEELHFTFMFGLPDRWWERPRQRSEQLPPGYVSFLISPTVEQAKKNWNHPSNRGISISTSRQEVLYWLN